MPDNRPENRPLDPDDDLLTEDESEAVEVIELDDAIDPEDTTATAPEDEPAEAAPTAEPTEG